jgi:hypothetical protein
MFGGLGAFLLTLNDALFLVMVGIAFRDDVLLFLLFVFIELVAAKKLGVALGTAVVGVLVAHLIILA